MLIGDLNGRAAVREKPRGGDERRSRGGVASERASDPLSRVLATGPRIPVAVTISIAILLHVGAAAGATAAAMFDEIFAWERGIRDVIAFRLSQYEIEVVKEPPPPPPEEPKPEPEEPKPVVKDNTPPPPPPQPAQAANVMTSDPDPNTPVDLTNTFVTGPGSTYAGGSTASNGTSKSAVYNPAAAVTGVPGGTGTGPGPVRKDDRSRAPGLLGSVDWNDCPFPGEADADQIDQAFVMIQVKVKPDGSPDTVTVLQDPGHGFGREARKCAMRKKFQQGLDPDGNPIAGTTRPFRVRFER